MKHYNHIIRFAIVLIIAVAGFFVMRGYLVQESFGIHGTYTYGYHRGNSDSEQAALPSLYQGPEKCKSCHEQQYTPWQAGAHAPVGCETCHGNWQAHNNNVKDKVQLTASIEACMLCHQQLGARPASFPQIPEIKAHVQEQDEEFSQGMSCSDCHDPHEPL